MAQRKDRGPQSVGGRGRERASIRRAPLAYPQEWVPVLAPVLVPVLLQAPPLGGG